MEDESIEARCAHLLFHGDDVVGLQWLLQGLSASELCDFPSTFVPTTDRTFLMACAKQGRASCCKLLLSLDSAASVNMQNAHGYTALHYASYQGHIEVAFLLLAAGADWRILNSHGESAYQTAISGKKFELVNRFQVSPYFAENYYAPSSSVIMTRHEAAQFKLEIVKVDSGGDRSLIGLDFHCLASTQRAVNRAPVNDLCGSAGEASGSVHYGSEDLYIGRARTNHVCMNDLSLSKQHAVICYIENIGFIVYDIGSKHGTFVNKERLLVGTDVYTKYATYTATQYTTNSADFSTADSVVSNDAIATADSSTSNTTIETAAVAAGPSTIPPTSIETTDANNLPLTENAQDAMSNTSSSTADNTTSSTTLNTTLSTTLNTTLTTAHRTLQTPPPQPTYLLEGMWVQFGRVHCKVVRKKQEAVLSSSFQPTSTVKPSAESALQQHHLAVQQRVRALLNVPDTVVVHTSGRAAVDKRSGGSSGGSGSSGSGKVGQKRKAESTINPPTQGTSHTILPTTLPTTSPMNNSLSTSDLNSANKGVQLLQKFGWTEGRAIGKSEEKAKQPIQVNRLLDRAGLGRHTMSASKDTKGTSDAHIIDESVDSEKTKAWKRMMARFAEQR